MQHMKSIIGTVVSGLAATWAWFEEHSAVFAALFAILAASFTIANIVNGWVKDRKHKQRKH